MAIDRRFFRLFFCIEDADDLGSVKIAEDGEDALIGNKNGNTDMGIGCTPQLVDQGGWNGMVIFLPLFDDGTDFVSICHISTPAGE